MGKSNEIKMFLQEIERLKEENEKLRDRLKSMESTVRSGFPYH